MPDLYHRRGRKPLAAARVSGAISTLMNQSAPVTTAAIRKLIPGVPAASLLRAIQWLQAEAGLLVRFIVGTNVREYLHAHEASRWGINLSHEQVLAHNRVVNTLRQIRRDAEVS